MIKAANGSAIENKGECDITFKIGPASFTFTFLVSNELTQDAILGYNFSKAYHIGTDWNKNDEMMLTMNGQQITTAISTKAINALVQCAESISIPPRSNAMIKCKAQKVLCHQNYGRICVFEPSTRHTSDNAACHTYNGTVVIDDDVKISGIFEIAMTNTSWKTVKIRRNTNMGLLESCAPDEICTIHKILTFDKPKDEQRPRVIEKSMYAIPIRTKTGKIEINTFVPLKEQPRIGIHEIGPQEDFCNI